MAKKRILMYGDSPIDGYKSYADTINEICKLLKNAYEIYIIAYNGDDFHKTDVYTILPHIKEFAKKTMSVPENIEYYSNILNPDLIFIHTDTNMFTQNIQDRTYLKEFIETSKIPFILYAVIDGLPIPNRDKDMFDFISEHGKIITFSKFAKEAYKNSEYIPHGIDLEYFKPLPNRKELRNKCGIEDEDIVIGFVGSCSTRKQPFRYLTLCKRLQKEYGDKVKCCFLCQPNEVLKEYIIDNEINLVDFPRSTSHMTEFYSLLDIFVLPTAGEGFCKPFVECAACGVPIVTTDCCTGPELVTGHGELVKVATIDYCFCCGISRYLCDEEDLYLKTKKLIDDKELREKYKVFGIEFAKSYEWKLWKDKWLEVFR